KFFSSHSHNPCRPEKLSVRCRLSHTGWMFPFRREPVIWATYAKWINLVTILHCSLTDQRRQNTERARGPRLVSSQLRRGHLRKECPVYPFCQLPTTKCRLTNYPLPARG